MYTEEEKKEGNKADAHSDCWREAILIQEDMSYCYSHCSDGNTKPKTVSKFPKVKN